MSDRDGLELVGACLLLAIVADCQQHIVGWLRWRILGKGGR